MHPTALMKSGLVMEWGLRESGIQCSIKLHPAMHIPYMVVCASLHGIPVAVTRGSQRVAEGGLPSFGVVEEYKVQGMGTRNSGLVLPWDHVQSLPLSGYEL